MPASSATSATAMSDGCVAMHESLAPRMAWLRLKPPMAAQPAPGVRLLHARRRIVEVQAPRALQQVAADRRLVAQLRRGARRAAPARAPGIARARGQFAATSRVRRLRADAQPAVGQTPRSRASASRLMSTRCVGLLDLELHQVEQVRAAADELRAGLRRSGDRGAARSVARS